MSPGWQSFSIDLADAGTHWLTRPAPESNRIGPVAVLLAQPCSKRLRVIGVGYTRPVLLRRNYFYAGFLRRHQIPDQFGD